MPDLMSPSVGKGFITIWTKSLSLIPNDWAICDGNNGTPDLRGKFVRCVPNNMTDPGTTGGESTHQLTTAEIPQHTHSWSESDHDHTLAVQVGNQNNGNGSPDLISFTGSTDPKTSGLSTSTESSGVTLNNAGSDTAHENEPANYEVVYIMKVEED